MARVAVTIVLLAVLCGGCGGGDEPEPAKPGTASEGSSLTGAGADADEFVGEAGTAHATACELISTPRVERVVAEAVGEPVPLEPVPNDSLDLSFCDYELSDSDDPVAISVGLDTAVRAVRRYYNMITEARQLPNILDPSKENRPQLVFGVGNDRTYGGAGAYWIPLRAVLTSIRGDQIVKVHFYVPGVPDREAKRTAAELARLAYEGYERHGG
jgi:hypothetical protein